MPFNPNEYISNISDFMEMVDLVNKEGGGMLSVNVFTPMDAMLLVKQLATTGEASLYYVEVDRFIRSIDDNVDVKPKCSCDRCVNEIHTCKELGVVVVCHAKVENPDIVFTSGMCVDCWKDKLEGDANKAIEAFSKFLNSNIPCFKLLDPALMVPGNNSIN